MSNTEKKTPQLQYNNILNLSNAEYTTFPKEQKH